MNKDKILSVSVASYNLGDMIRTNIESFVNSPVADKIELIITDDGSKDNTADIAEEYAKKYPNTVKVIRKVNEGPGSTVNSGIKNATGKYFRMVDGDDWVHTENLEEYIKFLTNTNADLVISDYDTFDNQQQKIIETNVAQLATNKELKFDEVFNNVPCQMHYACFKTSIFKENNIVLDNCFYTDVEYLLFPTQYVQTVSYFNKSIYVYRVAQATQSVNPNSMKKNIGQHERVFDNLLSTFIQNEKLYSQGIKSFIANRIAMMADVNVGTMLLFDASHDNKLKIKKFIENIKSKSQYIYRILLKSKKCKMLVWSNYVLYKLACKIYSKKFN